MNITLSKSPGFLYCNLVIPTKAPDVEAATVPIAEPELGIAPAHFYVLPILGLSIRVLQSTLTRDVIVIFPLGTSQMQQLQPREPESELI